MIAELPINSAFRALRRELDEERAYSDTLKGALATYGMNVLPKPAAAWALNLTPQERAFMGALYAGYPNFVPRDAVEAILPGHGRAREIQIVNVVAARVRQKLGKHVIASRWGEGYRLTEAGRELMGAA